MSVICSVQMFLLQLITCGWADVCGCGFFVEAMNERDEEREGERRPKEIYIIVGVECLMENVHKV